jgi:hypothetical protein
MPLIVRTKDFMDGYDRLFPRGRSRVALYQRSLISFIVIAVVITERHRAQTTCPP